MIWSFFANAVKWVLVFLASLILFSALFILVPVDGRAFRAALTQPLMIVEKEGDTLAPVGCICAAPLTPDEIPERLKQALIATEDKRFDYHFGVDPVGVFNMIRSRGARGGSTLAMQLSKNTLTGSAPTIWRKYAEVFFATRISLVYGREDVLRLYLSRVNFGRLNGVPVYGLRDAAQGYFGVAPPQLTLAQSAILVAMVNGPSLYNPYRRPDAVENRARLVLRRMQEQGMIADTGAIDLAAAMPRRVHRPPPRDRYLEDQVMREMEAVKHRLPDGHLFALTTIDPVAQAQARRVLRGAVRGARSKGVARAGLITMDGQGRVLSMIGGLDYASNTWNHAIQARRQAASTAKLATYLTALEAGMTPASLVEDRRDALKGRFRPRNADFTYLGTVSMSDCLRYSRNVCTYWIAQKVGFDAIAKMAGRIGLTDGTEPGESVVLGASETTLIDNTAAYSAIAQGGLRHRPFILRGVLSRNGNMAWRQWPWPKRVVSAEVAGEMKRMLARVTDPGGTGAAAQFKGGAAFGKTGTSQENRDAWFVGFTGDGISTGVWVGPREGRRMRGVSGGDLPARVFARYNQNVVERFHAYVTRRSAQSSGYWRDINRH
ncbi:transglycosylase domain-containing protein [Rhodalgimonas zhirmunskyi]|nr:transglycosylase domain-containing protein [Rhodoalgimonas zhirmunskyi]